MNILLANKFFFLNGGSERVFFQERDFLIASGINVIDFSMKDDRNVESKYSDFFISNINYNKFDGLIDKLNKSLSLVHSKDAISKLSHLVERHHPQIAHLHNIYHQITPSIIPYLKSKGVRVVLTLHDYKLVCPSYLALRNEDICNLCINGKFYRTATSACAGSMSQSILLTIEAYWHRLRKSYDNVDIFISPSQFLAHKVLTRIPADRLRILRNGINTVDIQPTYDDDSYILYLGRLSKEKGVWTLLKAYHNSNIKIPLFIAGTGPLEKRLKKEYPDVNFLGFRTGDGLNELLQRCSYVVVPSEWYENCSMVVLEAMAFGKPVIGTRIGGIPEQIDDNKTGFLFEIGDINDLSDKMKRLAEDRKLRISMGRMARKKCEHEFSLSSHCGNLLKIYSEMNC